MSTKNSFAEIQRFTQWWIWLLLIALAALPALIKVYSFCVRSSSIEKTLDVQSIIISGFAGSLVVVLFLVMQLNTRIDHEGIQVRFFPFHWRYRTYKWSEIESASVRKYSPLLEYGGWGLRGFGSNRAFNVRGNMGLQLVFKNGDRLLIGTQRVEEITKLLAEISKE